MKEELEHILLYCYIQVWMANVNLLQGNHAKMGMKAVSGRYCGPCLLDNEKRRGSSNSLKTVCGEKIEKETST